MTPHLPGPKALQVTSMLVQRCQLHIQAASAATLCPVQTQPSLKAKEAERLLPARLRLVEAHHCPPCTASNACRSCTHQPLPPISQCQHATAHCPGTTAGSHAGNRWNRPGQTSSALPHSSKPDAAPAFKTLPHVQGTSPAPPIGVQSTPGQQAGSAVAPPPPPTDSPGPGQRLGRLRRGSQHRLLPEDHPAGRAGRAAAAAARLLLPHLLRTLLFCSLPADGTKSRGCHGHLSH